MESLRYPVWRDPFSVSLALSQQGAILFLGAMFFFHRHINAIPHFANISRDDCAIPQEKQAQTTSAMLSLKASR